MKEITQLILDGVRMPMSSNDRYSCGEEPLQVDLVMAAGNMVREVPDKNKVYVASYAFDVLDDDTYRAAMAVLRRGSSFPAAVLPDDKEDMIPSQFFCTSLTRPTFAFSDGGKPVWHNLAFTLREVEPHA